MLMRLNIFGDGEGSSQINRLYIVFINNHLSYDRWNCETFVFLNNIYAMIVFHANT